MLLASAVMAASGLWTASAGAAPIRADMSLQSDAMFEQVQMHGGRGSGGMGGGGSGISRGSGGGGGGAGISRGAGPGFSGGAAMNRSGGPGISRGAAINSGGNLTGTRVISGGNWAANRDGRRHSSDWRGRHRFRGPGFAFGFGPSYYDYGYYGYPYYDDYAYGDDYVAASPGVADGDSVAYCQQRFRSYDPSTGTYLGRDGLRHPCP
jgi:BA14K-like protein